MENKAQLTINSIDKAELLQKIQDKKQFQLVNVLAPENYNLGFIKGSRKIPLTELDRRSIELDKKTEVITYCANYDCPASRQAAEKLAAKGFKTRVYEGGIKEWKESGFPVE
ncbi:MAG: rhodanese-like domain-containing protein [Candidatus Omnitrophota bacterium]